MGQITSLFAHKVIACADPRGEQRHRLQDVGLDPAAPIDPKVMIEDRAYYDFFATMARSDDGGATLPLRVGASMRCDEYGAFGLAWKSAPTLGGSFNRAERYARVLTSVATYEVEGSNDGIFYHLHRDGDRRDAGFCLSNEATIASVAAISNEVSTVGFQAKAVFFKHRGPGSSADHETHFRCPVHFTADRDALLIDENIVSAPNRVGDTTIARFFDTHLEQEVSELEREKSLAQQVKAQIGQALSDGVPPVSGIAAELNMSARTLQRKLSDAGYSFQSLVDEARRELATRLLRETAYPLADVAFLTGFSEQSAFNRAFKRWSGETPRSFRLGA